jgi:hypothetical protein
MTAGLAAGSRHGALGPRLFLIEFTGPRKTPSAVLPEEWRVSRFIPKNGPRKTRNHFQTLTLPKPSAPPKPPALFQKMIMSSMILSNPSNSPGAHRDAATSRTPQAPASPKKMILLSMILSNSVGDGAKPDFLPEQNQTVAQRLNSAWIQGQMALGVSETTQNLRFGW